MMPITLEQLKSRVQPWVEPISAEAPTGKSAKFEPGYESLLREVGKLESPHGGAVDWEQVVGTGRELLRATSKDLLLTCYTAYGLLATRGLDGLVEGMAALAELMDRYWPTLYPEPTRLRARANALSWFLERSARALNGYRVGAADRETVESLAVAAERLADVSREKLGEQSPAFGGLLRSIEQLQHSVPEEAPVAPAEPTKTPAHVAATLTDPSQSVAFLQQLGSTLVAAARTLRHANLTDPVPLRILRSGLWLHLSELPSTGLNGRTAIEPFPASRRTQLEQMSAHSKWAELLEESESALENYRFNLDLQYFSSQALAAMGPAYQAARTALLAEVGAFVRRLPRVVELLANDGSPLANSATREWLAAEVVGGPASGGANSSESIDEAALVSQAFQLFSDGRSEDALKLLHRQDGVAGGRTQFRLRLQLAKTCAARGQTALASGLFLGLQQECLQHQLHLWEPALAIECLEGFLKSVRARSKEAVFRDFVEQYQLLCRLDPGAALRIDA